MRRQARVLWIGCVLTALGVGPAAAQDWATKMFEIREHNFGVVPRGAKAEFRFEFKNIYTEEIHVANARSSCGCTLVRVENPNVKTYETGAIVATVNSRAFLGAKGATITVTFDKPQYAEVQLRVQSYIRSDVEFEPECVRFGTVEQGAEAEQTVVVNRIGRGDWRVLEVKSGVPYLSAEVLPPERTSNGINYPIKVRLSGDAPAGSLHEYLTLITNDPQLREVPLMVEGNIEALVTVTPTLLFLGVVKPGQSVSRQLVVRGRQPFSIVGTECSDCPSGSLQCQIPTGSEPRTLHIVAVKFTAGDQEGRVNIRLHIRSDREDMPIPETTAVALVKN